MIELRLGFQNYEEYVAWRAAQGSMINAMVNSAVRDIAERGITEPFTDRHFREVKIDQSKLQVSLDAGMLNSRKRAGLLAVQAAVSALPKERRRNPKILGTEGVTQIARILRYAFPYYLSTEYLPTLEEQHQQYPIEHLDLMDIQLPDSSFDVFFSAHVLEHVPSINRAIHQTARVLRPGGVLVSTYPFRSDRIATETKAIINDKGEIEHLAEPEYHGNPVRVEEGSLVFQLPGWDILEMCREAGLSDAKLLLLASTRHGVISPGTLGIFALFARKPMPDEDTGTTLPEIVNYRGPYF